MNAYWRFLIKKALITILTIFVTLTANFFIFRIMPGDPAKLLLNDPRLKKENIELVKKQLGLDKPLWQQYLIYMKESFKGNFGISFVHNVPVSQIIAQRLPQTLLLLSVAIAISTVVGIAVGAICGWKRGSKLDAALLTASLISYMVPTFWIGIVLLMVFSLWLGWFPVGGITTIGGGAGIPRWLDVLKHMFLPTVALVLWYAGEYVILMRGSMLDVMKEDYILTAKAKGLRSLTILKDHAVRNALLPVVTLIALNIGWMVGGCIEVEVVFSWPGMGKLIYDAVLKRDYPVLQGCFVIITITVILANLIADLIYGYIDPRIRRGTM